MASDAVLNLSRMHHPVTTLGPGRRIGIWVQGCSIGCRGCVSRDTWDPAAGRPMDVDDLVRHIAAQVEVHSLDGVTVSGGEPFEQARALHRLLSGLRAALPSTVDVLVYSGRTWTALQREFPDTIALADAVISEPYLDGSPPDRAWVGSANQRVHAMTELGRERYAELPCRRPELQVAVEGGGVWLIGIPGRNDLARFRELLSERGVELEAVSWQP